jgi:hypothetical protein
MFQTKGKLFRLFVPVVVGTTFASCKFVPTNSSPEPSPREYERSTIEKMLQRGKLYVLTGPKEIGKSTLVRDLKSRDISKVLIDLKGKNRIEDIQRHVFAQIEDYREQNMKTEKTVTSKIDMSANPSLSVDIVKKSESGSPLDLTVDGASMLRAAQALFDEETNKFFFISPSAMIIDEAQTLKIFEQSDREDFFAYISSLTRDGKLAVLLVTSDYESLVQLTGTHAIFN